MKKIFQMIGLISLTCFSFFITEKTATVVNDLDDIMIEIKENEQKYKKDSVDATIIDNTVIPGIKGREVNIKKSYKNMRTNGFYSDKLYIYDYTKPKVSIEDNKSKYIIKGNPNKRMVSLIFVVKGDTDISDVLNIVNNYNIKSTFFVDNNWFYNNDNYIEKIINKGHNIGLLLDDYTNVDFEWMDMVIKKVNKQSIGFCYGVEDNDVNLKECELKNNYTIRPVVISDRTPMVDIKEKLDSGSLLSLSINSTLKKELPSILIYIKSKNYIITNLEENVLE